MTPTLPSPEQVFRSVPCLCGVMLIAARSVARLYNEELRDSGLEVTQHAMLMTLKAVGPMPQSALAQRLAADKTTISRNVKVLEARGWVQVVQGEDARERVVSISKAGAAVLDRARAGWDRAQARMRGALKDGEFEHLRRRMPEIAIAAHSA